VAGVEGVANMRTWTMALMAGLGLLTAGITVASRAWAAEFSCKIPWYGGTDCGIPKFTIRAQEKLTVGMTSVKIAGKELDDPCPFIELFDINNNDTLLDSLELCVGKPKTYQNKNKETDQTVRVRINISKNKDVDIQGSYKIGK
jgi:hypothetical protein